MILLIFLVIITTFLQSTFLGINLTLAIVLSLIASGINKSTVTLIFCIGIFYDLLMMQTLGTTALFYLIILAIVYGYERKFKNKNFFFLFVVGLLVFTLDKILFFQTINITISLIESAIFLLIFWPLKSLLSKKEIIYD